MPSEEAISSNEIPVPLSEQQQELQRSCEVKCENAQCRSFLDALRQLIHC
jgi:hypothetical protein